MKPVHWIFAAVLVAAGTAAAQPRAQANDPDAKEISEYRLNMGVIQRYAAFVKKAGDDPACRKCFDNNPPGKAPTLDAGEKIINACPAAVAGHKAARVPDPHRRADRGHDGGGNEESGGDPEVSAVDLAGKRGVRRNQLRQAQRSAGRAGKARPVAGGGRPRCARAGGAGYTEDLPRIGSHPCPRRSFICTATPITRCSTEPVKSRS